MLLFKGYQPSKQDLKEIKNLLEWKKRLKEKKKRG